MIITTRAFVCEICGYTKTLDKDEVIDTCPACSRGGSPYMWKYEENDVCLNCPVRKSPTWNGVCHCTLGNRMKIIC